jgi:ribosomal protein S8
LININIKYKKKFFKKKILKREMGLIRIFLKINLIKYLKKTNSDEYVIFLNLGKKKEYFSIKNFFKTSNPIVMRKKELLKILKLKKQIILLSTSSGVKLANINDFTTGGLLIAKVHLNN